MHTVRNTWSVHMVNAKPSGQCLRLRCLASAQACIPAHAPRLQLVVAGVARQRGVVALDVELELALQAVGAQEVHGGGRIPVVLVLGRLLVATGAKNQVAVLAECGARRGASFAWQSASKGCRRFRQAWQRQYYVGCLEAFGLGATPRQACIQTCQHQYLQQSSQSYSACMDKIRVHCCIPGP